MLLIIYNHDTPSGLWEVVVDYLQSFHAFGILFYGFIFAEGD